MQVNSLNESWIEKYKHVYIFKKAANERIK